MFSDYPSIGTMEAVYVFSYMKPISILPNDIEMAVELAMAW